MSYGWFYFFTYFFLEELPYTIRSLYKSFSSYFSREMLKKSGDIMWMQCVAASDSSVPALVSKEDQGLPGVEFNIIVLVLFALHSLVFPWPVLLPPPCPTMPLEDMLACWWWIPWDVFLSSYLQPVLLNSRFGISMRTPIVLHSAFLFN